VALVASLGLLHPQILSLEAVPFKGGRSTRWKEMQQRMIAAGDWDASRDGLIGLMQSTQEQAPTT